jgi:hypothetical protein
MERDFEKLHGIDFDSMLAMLIGSSSRLFDYGEECFKPYITTIAQTVKKEVLAELSFSIGYFYFAAIDPEFQISQGRFKIDADIARNLDRSIRTADMYLFLGSIPYFDVQTGDKLDLISWLLLEFDKLDFDEGVNVPERCFEVFSKFNIHPRCQENFLSNFQFFVSNLDKVWNRSGFKTFYIFLLQMLCLQAKPIVEYVDIFSQYVLDSNCEAVIKLCSLDMVEIWKLVRKEIKSRADYNARDLTLLISVSTRGSVDGMYDTVLEDDLKEFMWNTKCSVDAEGAFFRGLRQLPLTGSSRIMEEALKMTTNCQANRLRMMEFLSRGFTSSVTKGDFRKAYDFYVTVIQVIGFLDPVIIQSMPKFIADLVKCDFKQSTGHQRREMLHFFWSYDKESFLVIFDKVQDHFILESRIFEVDVVDFINRKEQKTEIDLFVYAKISQNSLVVIRDDFFSQLLSLRGVCGYEISPRKLKVAFKCIVDSKKRFRFLTRDIGKTVKDNIAKSYFSLSMNVGTEVLFHEAGRLCGYLFNDAKENLEFMNISRNTLYSQVYFYLGYLLEVPNNAIVQEAFFGLLKSASRVRCFRPLYSKSCECAAIFRLVRLNLRHRVEEILDLMSDFCCFSQDAELPQTAIDYLVKCILREPSVVLQDAAPIIRHCVYEDDETEEAFLMLIADRWDSLADEERRELVTKAETIHCPTLIMQIGLTGYSSELLLKAVESCTFRAEAMPFFDAIKKLETRESVRLKIAAHWFFVDDFEDICKNHNEHLLLGLAIAGMSDPK